MLEVGIAGGAAAQQDFVRDSHQNRVFTGFSGEGEWQ